MKKLCVICFALLTSISIAQVRMYVTINGQRVGQAVAFQKVLPDGGKRVQLSMNLAGPNGATITLRMESTYDAKGGPLRKFEESLTSSPRKRRTVTVTFDKKTANVIEEKDGVRTMKSVPLVASAPTESKSEWWFLRDTPKLGDVDKYYHFNISNLEWSLRTTIYGGLKTITVGGKKVQAHELKQSEGTAYVDAQGLPYRLVIGQIQLERIPAGTGG